MILLIDNYDSFTYNLVQVMLSAGVEVEVVRNDARSVDELLRSEPAGIVLSPGPGRPESAGVCLELAERARSVPMLGVCLGHQCLAAVGGAVIERAEQLMHGKTSEVRFLDDPLFEGIERPFIATRYHSLAVRTGTLPSSIRPIAWSEDETIMALRHLERPHWGVQFHPESILTPSGPRLIANFLEFCDAERRPEGSSNANSARKEVSHGSRV